MAAASSLLLPHELGIHKRNGYSSQSRAMMDKSNLQSSGIALSSLYSRQDPWTLHLLNSVRGPLNPVYTRCNVFVCQALLKPSGANEIPAIKTAAVILTRSYNAFTASPLMLRLVPAVGVIAFAVWGLGPLTRLGRVLLFHKSDDNWQKSSTHYFVASYLRPLLLWTGATLMCRALDPVILSSMASQAVKQRLLNFVQSLSTVLAFAYCLSSLIQQTQKFFVEAKDSNDARNMGFEFAGKAVYSAVWIAAVSLFMELLGFSTQKWLTAGGLGTVLLTLAGREIFTNFLSSIMIHATRPFVLNDWIQTKIEGYEVSGTVEHVGWWSPTVIRGDDREAIHIPNHKFTVNIVRNLSQKTHWRIKTHLAISHLDVNKINNIVADMRKVIAKNPQIEQKKLHRRVFLDNVDPETQALLIMVSCFVKTPRFEEYLCVKEAVLLDLLRVISHHRARLATPIRSVQKIYNEANMENVPFSETMFTRGTAANRPLLMIETKASPRSAQPSEEKDLKVEAQTSDFKVESETGSTSSIEENTSFGKVTSTSNSDSNLKTKVDEISTDGEMGRKEVIESNSEKQGANGMAVGEQLIGATGPKSEDQLTRGTVVEKKAISFPEMASEKTDTVSTISEGKLEGERPIPSPSAPRPVLEDNIVLGVALEGSKRTLPIEDEMAPSAFAESKELAACLNANSSTAAGKDKNDDQAAGIQTAMSSDQQEKER